MPMLKIRENPDENPGHENPGQIYLNQSESSPHGAQRNAGK
jgi:hypothetical protein